MQIFLNVFVILWAKFLLLLPIFVLLWLRLLLLDARLILLGLLPLFLLVVDLLFRFRLLFSGRHGEL